MAGLWNFVGLLCVLSVVEGAHNFSQVPITGFGVFPSMIADFARPFPTINLLNLPVTLQMRAVHYPSLAYYEVWSKYTTTSKGFLTLDQYRRPVSEHTALNKNVGIAFACYRLFVRMHPELTATGNAWMSGLGLDVTDQSTDTTTAVGLGNVIGKLWGDFAVADGLNQDGTLGSTNEKIASQWKVPFADYTGYTPENTAYELNDPARWQPLIDTVAGSTAQYWIQSSLTPQAGYGFSLAYPSSVHNSGEIAQQFDGPYAAPKGSSSKRAAFKKQADDILSLSANLTDNQKFIAEFFDAKFRIIGETQGVYSATHPGPVSGLIPWNLDDFAIALAVADYAAYSSAIVAWRAKHVFDYVRPTSAIRFLYPNKNVTAWSGPYGGTKNFPSREWRSYLRTMPHPEYPSGTTCLCAAIGRARTLLFGTDSINPPITFTMNPGTSFIEPGLTPVTTQTLTYSTWTDYTNACGFSRQLAGVHFEQSVQDALELCPQIGESMFNVFTKYYQGTATTILNVNQREIFES